MTALLGRAFGLYVAARAVRVGWRQGRMVMALEQQLPPSIRYDPLLRTIIVPMAMQLDVMTQAAKRLPWTRPGVGSGAPGMLAPLIANDWAHGEYLDTAGQALYGVSRMAGESDGSLRWRVQTAAMMPRPITRADLESVALLGAEDRERLRPVNLDRDEWERLVAEGAVG